MLFKSPLSIDGKHQMTLSFFKFSSHLINIPTSVYILENDIYFKLTYYFTFMVFLKLEIVDSEEKNPKYQKPYVFFFNKKSIQLFFAIELKWFWIFLLFTCSNSFSQFESFYISDDMKILINLIRKQKKNCVFSLFQQILVSTSYQYHFSSFHMQLVKLKKNLKKKKKTVTDGRG